MVYYPINDVDIPEVDLLTLLFDHPLTWLQENEVAHAEAADPSNSVTKSQLRTITKRLISVFRNEFGIGANGAGKDVVVCMSSGQILLPSIFYGVIGAGGVFSAASSAFTVGELARQMKQGPGSLIVVSEDCTEVGIKTAKECGIPMERVLIMQTMGGKRELCDATGKGKNYFLETKEMDWEKVTNSKTLTERAICLLYSSGTTGPPKGVHISHRNMVAAGVVPQLVYRQYYTAQKEKDPNWTFPVRTIAHLPAAHIAGCQGYFVNPTIAGGVLYWMPKFDFVKFCEYNKTLEITSFFTVPPIYLLIAKSPLVTDHFKTLRNAVTGAAPMGPELQALAQSRLGGGTVRIGQTWGLSETTGSCTVAPFDYSDPTGGISPLLPNVRMRIVDDDEKDVPEGQEGEFLIKAPNVTFGYWKDQKATRESFTSDGWYKTGDIGLHKNEKFYIVDRKKELIKYKGIQVAPAELEALLVSHNHIQDAAVIGVPDPSGSGNELPRAYVVVADKSKASEDQIKDFVKSNLATHKQLRGGVVYLDVIPKSPSGKILRRVLRDMAKKEGAMRQAKL